ncbi:uncharacterized protein UHOD_11783 [Ustilago sp. UG-2017b]|nr:uncharacterized protein UHOD_11783 [Ustilago sp. UG-2017b]
MLLLLLLNDPIEICSSVFGITILAELCSREVPMALLTQICNRWMTAFGSMIASQTAGSYELPSVSIVIQTAGCYEPPSDVIMYGVEWMRIHSYAMRR